MTDFEQILTDVSENVLTITLNRPDRLNAWTGTMGRELAEAFDRADADDEVRAQYDPSNPDGGRGRGRGGNQAATPPARSPPTRSIVGSTSSWWRRTRDARRSTWRRTPEEDASPTRRS